MCSCFALSQATKGGIVHLNLSGCGITGCFPEEIYSACGTLTALDLSNNSLRGPIPSSISKLHSLAFLSLQSNGFVGEIPSTIAKLGRLKQLCAQCNQLSGSLAEQIGFMDSLEALVVSGNRLGGQLPMSIVQLASSHEEKSGRRKCKVHLGNNLGFTLPEEVTELFLKNAPQTLDLTDWNLRGPLPESLYQMLFTLDSYKLRGNRFDNIVKRTLDATLVYHLTNFKDQHTLDLSNRYTIHSSHTPLSYT
jgi:hypothetical protein